MPTCLHRALLAALLLGWIAPASAQSRTKQDVLYLKDGTVIRGSIVRQQPGEWVRILMLGGSVLVVRQRDIQRIAVEANPYGEVKLRYNRRRLRQRF